MESHHANGLVITATTVLFLQKNLILDRYAA